MPLHRHPQFDPVVRRMNQILFRTEIPLGRLDTRVAKKQLNLLKFAAGRAAQLRRRAPQIMGRDARYAGGRRVWPQELPHDLLR